ncbi:hypothetical protein [Streptomyces sp. NPDC002758]
MFEGEDVRLIPNTEGALTTPSLVLQSHFVI